jgi:hypothetical protein
MVLPEREEEETEGGEMEEEAEEEEEGTLPTGSREGWTWLRVRFPLIRGVNVRTTKEHKRSTRQRQL